MFRQFFRIGFGGCGCALEEHFRTHAVDLACDLLNTFYLKKLEGWKEVLSRDPKFGMDTVVTLNIILNKELTDTTFNEKLREIAAELDSWYGLSMKAEGTGMSYEDDIIKEIRHIITTMKNEVDDTENKGGVLFESLPVDSFTKSEERKAERFYVYNQNITETRELIVDQFGHAVIESQGFNHQPELQMLPFSIKEVRDEVYKKIIDYIAAEKLKKAASRGYFFFVGLGGGTGTGVISPLAEKFGKGSLGYLTLAVLGGKEDTARLKSQQPWFRRCFNMLIALNDLIVTAELDGIILVDNDVLIKTIDNKEKTTLVGDKLMKLIDEVIIENIYPAFGLTSLETEGMDLDWAQLRGPIGLHKLEKKPPVIVPCYASGDCDASGDNLEKLIDTALENKLASCAYIKKDKTIVEKVFVYARCIQDDAKVLKKLAGVFKIEEDNIAIIKNYLFCWDDVEGDNYKDIRRFLRDVCMVTWADSANIMKPSNNDEELKLVNPDKVKQCITIKIGKYLFDWKKVLTDFEELKRYLEKLKIKWQTPIKSKDKISIGEAEITLDDQEKKATLKWHDKKIVLHVKDRKIYLPSEDILDYSEELKEDLMAQFDITNIAAIKPDLGVKKMNKKRHVYLQGCSATKNWIKVSLGKKVIVFESQEIGSFWHEPSKKNEILILLVNPDVEEALRDRLQDAKKFVELLVKFRELINTEAEESLRDKLDIANDILNGEIKNDDLNATLNKIPQDDITKDEDKPLAQAKKFLFPEELYEKDKRIYDHMGDILHILKQEVERIPKEGEEKEWWPIFREKIFNIVSISGKRDEVILSAISALDEKTSTRFDRLAGKGVYDTYFRTYKRQFFKYNARYLYLGGGAEYILSDDAEEKLPKKLRDMIDENDVSITGSTLEGWVMDCRDEPVRLFRIKKDMLRNQDILPDLKKDFDRNKITLSANPVYMEGAYLFNWEKIPGEDSQRFIEFLKGDLTIDCIEDAEIERKDSNTICVSSHGSNTIYISSNESEVNREGSNILKINDEIKKNLKLKEVNNERYVYKEDDNERTIIDGDEIYRIMDEDVYGPSDLSFPAMLALAGLYANWQLLGRWDIDKKSIDPDDGNLKQALFNNVNLDSVDFKIYTPDEVKNNENIPNILIIDEKDVDATLIIRHGSGTLFEWTPEESEDTIFSKLSLGNMPDGLKEMFKREHIDIEGYEPAQEGTEWKLQPKPEKIENKKRYIYYHIRKNESTFEILGDRIHKLKVKREENGRTLKIYKRRGEQFY